MAVAGLAFAHGLFGSFPFGNIAFRAPGAGDVPVLGEADEVYQEVPSGPVRVGAFHLQIADAVAGADELHQGRYLGFVARLPQVTDIDAHHVLRPGVAKASGHGFVGFGDVGGLQHQFGLLPFVEAGGDGRAFQAPNSLHADLEELAITSFALLQGSFGHFAFGDVEVSAPGAPQMAVRDDAGDGVEEPAEAAVAMASGGFQIGNAIPGLNELRDGGKLEFPIGLPEVVEARTDDLFGACKAIALGNDFIAFRDAHAIQQQFGLLPSSSSTGTGGVISNRQMPWRLICQNCR